MSVVKIEAEIQDYNPINGLILDSRIPSLGSQLH
jgi:hypothetical protein